MALIELETSIAAPPAVVFDLARDVELHLRSTARTREQAIAGRTSGLFELHDTVTWRAKHLGFWQTLTVAITEFDRPHRFVDEMTRGIFHSLRHEHLFLAENPGTRMIDRFEFFSPLGPLGRFVDWIFLRHYLARFLKERNAMIRRVAEGDAAAGPLAPG